MPYEPKYYDNPRLKREMDRRRAREDAAAQTASATGRAVVYTDRDGCEVTVTPAGHVFYNAADWW